jgi:hypothetical protein
MKHTFIKIERNIYHTNNDENKNETVHINFITIKLTLYKTKRRYAHFIKAAQRVYQCYPT